MAKVLLRDINSITVYRRFQAVQYTGDDGYPAACLFDVVAVALYDGREFYLPNAKMVARKEEPGCLPIPRYRCGFLVDKILSSREIETDHWIEVKDRTGEEMAEDAWNEEVKDRMDHGDSRFMH